MVFVDCIIIEYICRNNMQGPSNLCLSSKIIYFQKTTQQQGQLTLTNTHKQLSMIFKIKTKIQKVFQVKPPKGLIKPGESLIIKFKPISKLNDENIKVYQEKLQYLIQAYNLKSPSISKEEQDNIWAGIKKSTTDISLGYVITKVRVKFAAAQLVKYIPNYSSYQSKQKKDQKVFNSEVKSQKSSTQSNSQQNKQFGMTSNINPSFQNNDTLSQRFQQLKQEHLTLQKQREDIFKVKSKSKGKSGNTNLIIAFIIFIVFFLVGNYVKSVLMPTPTPVQVEKSWFEKLFNL